MRRIFLLAVIATALGQTATRAQVLFDSITGRPLAFPGTPGRSYVGEAINMVDPGTGAPVAVTRMDTFLVSATATAYNDIQLRVQFWNTASDATSGATPAFSNPAGGPLVFDFGAFTTGANAAYTINGLSFGPGGVIVSNLTNVGITLNWEGDTGTGLASTDNLTSGVGGSTAVAVGSVAANGGNGYYRNASGEADFNFLGSDFRTLTAPSAEAFRLYGASAPEPGSLALCGLAACGAVCRFFRRRRTA